MWKKFTTCIFVLVMALTLTGCNEDPFPGRRSDEAKTDASGGGQQHGGHDAGGSGGVDIQKACVPQCGGKVCGDNGCDKSCGTCSDNETCSAGQCVATGNGNNTGTHPCEGCKQGILCYQVSGLSLKCQAFDSGLCTADGKCASSGLVFDDSCSDNNSATADTVASYSTYVTKDKLCIHTPIGGGGGQTGGVVTQGPENWSVKTGPDANFLIVWVFSSNKFGGTELFYKEYSYTAAMSQDQPFSMPGGAGLVCYTAKYQPSNGSALWSPGQVGPNAQSDADKAKFATNTAVQRTIFDKSGSGASWTAGPGIAPCVNDMGTKAGCLIGKVYSGSGKSTDNWICHIP